MKLTLGSEGNVNMRLWIGSEKVTGSMDYRIKVLRLKPSLLTREKLGQLPALL